MQKLSAVIKYILVALISAMFVVTTVQVIMRYLFNTGLSWSEELVRFIFVWASFLGGAIGVKEHIHIGVDVLVNLLPPNLRRYADTLVYSIIFVFGAFLVYAGTPVVIMTHSQLSPAIMMPMSWVYIAIPLAGFFIMVYSVAEIVLVWKKRETRKEA